MNEHPRASPHQRRRFLGQRKKISVVNLCHFAAGGPTSNEPVESRETRRCSHKHMSVYFGGMGYTHDVQVYGQSVFQLGLGLCLCVLSRSAWLQLSPYISGTTLWFPHPELGVVLTQQNARWIGKEVTLSHFICLHDIHLMQRRTTNKNDSIERHRGKIRRQGQDMVETGDKTLRLLTAPLRLLDQMKLLDYNRKAEKLFIVVFLLFLPPNFFFLNNQYSTSQLKLKGKQNPFLSLLHLSSQTFFFMYPVWSKASGKAAKSVPTVPLWF